MVLGITGISGSGKHTAALFFKKRQWVILDADSMAQKAYRPYKEAWKKIVENFGEEILNQDDTINRTKIGNILFNSKDEQGGEEARGRLNQIVHPATNRTIKDEIHRHYRRKSNLIVIAAWWEELELADFCDKIILIKANAKGRQKRIQNRDGISEEYYERRVRYQTEPSEPDFLVENNGDVNELYKKLNEIYVNLTSSISEGKNDTMM